MCKSPYKIRYYYMCNHFSGVIELRTCFNATCTDHLTTAGQNQRKYFYKRLCFECGTRQKEARDREKREKNHNHQIKQRFVEIAAGLLGHDHDTTTTEQQQEQEQQEQQLAITAPRPPEYVNPPEYTDSPPPPDYIEEARGGSIAGSLWPEDGTDSQSGGGFPSPYSFWTRTGCTGPRRGARYI